MCSGVGLVMVASSARRCSYDAVGGSRCTTSCRSPGATRSGSGDRHGRRHDHALRCRHRDAVRRHRRRGDVRRTRTDRRIRHPARGHARRGTCSSAANDARREQVEPRRAGRAARRHAGAARDHGREPIEFGADWARQSRYVSLVAAMTLPALAIAADAMREALALVRSRSRSRSFLVGIPANIHSRTRCTARAADTRRRDPRHDALAPPRSARTDTCRDRFGPNRQPQPTVTIGWLLDAERHGKLACARAASRPISRRRTSSAFRSPGHPLRCRTRTAARPARSIVVEPHRGDRIGLHDDGREPRARRRALIGLPLPIRPRQSGRHGAPRRRAHPVHAVADGRSASASTAGSSPRARR